MTISDLHEGEMGKIVESDAEFLVVARDPEDRSSGVTHVHYLTGATRVFIWDYENPEVVRTGKGRLEIRRID